MSNRSTSNWGFSEHIIVLPKEDAVESKQTDPQVRQLAEQVKVLVKVFWDTLPHCCGYPKCDGDLVGIPHSAECPLHGTREMTMLEFAAAFASHTRREALREAEEAVAAEQNEWTTGKRSNVAVWDACDNIRAAIRLLAEEKK